MTGKMKKLAAVAVLLAVLAVAALTVFTVLLVNNDKSEEVIMSADKSDGLIMADEQTSSENNTDSVGTKALAAAIAVGLAAAAGAIGMGIAIAKSTDSIARQPEVKGDIRATLMLGLVFIETVVIYSLIVAILVIFVM